MSGRATHGIPHSAPARPSRRSGTAAGIQPIASADELAFPGVWESDEELDDFLADLSAARRSSLRDGRVVADVVRLDKGHTEGLEPRVTEELIKLMVAAPGGKVRALSSASAQAG